MEENITKEQALMIHKEMMEQLLDDFLKEFEAYTNSEFNLELMN